MPAHPSASVTAVKKEFPEADNAARPVPTQLAHVVRTKVQQVRTQTRSQEVANVALHKVVSECLCNTLKRCLQVAQHTCCKAEAAASTQWLVHTAQEHSDRSKLHSIHTITPQQLF